jgi:hypothetical protein
VANHGLAARHGRQGDRDAAAEFRESSDEPSPFMDIELHQALVSHFQQGGFARFLIRNIGAFHDLVYFEPLLAEARSGFLDRSARLYLSKRAKSLRIRKLIFRDHSLNIP